MGAILDYGRNIYFRGADYTFDRHTLTLQSQGNEFYTFNAGERVGNFLLHPFHKAAVYWDHGSRLLAAAWTIATIVLLPFALLGFAIKEFSEYANPQQFFARQISLNYFEAWEEVASAVRTWKIDAFSHHAAFSNQKQQVEQIFGANSREIMLIDLYFSHLKDKNVTQETLKKTVSEQSKVTIEFPPSRKLLQHPFAQLCSYLTKIAEYLKHEGYEHEVSQWFLAKDQKTLWIRLEESEHQYKTDRLGRFPSLSEA